MTLHLQPHADSINAYVRRGFRTSSELNLEGAVTRLLVATKQAAFQLVDTHCDWVEETRRDRLEALRTIFDHFHIALRDLEIADQALLAIMKNVIEHDQDNLFQNVHRSFAQSYEAWLNQLRNVA